MTTTLNLLSYNIHKGFSTTNRRFTLDTMREAIRACGAELVLLQEVQGRHDKKAQQFKGQWPDASQFEYLADQIWPHYAYGQNALYDQGHHGNAILSKYPILRWENFNVSTNRFEQRGILHAVIGIPDIAEPLHCFCLHFNLLQKGRMRQLDELCRIVHENVPASAPLIIGGDFNDWSWRTSERICDALSVQEVFRKLNGRYAKSFPSRLPLIALDRIYSRGLIPHRAEVLRSDPWRGLSDHTALRVVLGLD